MSKGYTGKFIRINLTDGSKKVENFDQNFYRKYLGGGGFGTYFLLKETEADTDPLSPENVITIAPGITTGSAVSGVSRCGLTALSPETGGVGDSQAGGSFGPYLKRAGWDAVILTGKADKLSYILIEDEEISILNAEDVSGKSILDARGVFEEKYGKKGVSVMQCGPAGEKLVKYASVSSDLHDAYGRTGMGAVFGSKNIRAVVVKSTGVVEFEDPEGLKTLAKTAISRIPGSGFVSIVKKYGTEGLVIGNAEAGNFCVHNYSTGYHKDYAKLDRSNYNEDFLAKGTTCYGCAVGCRKTVKSETPYKVTDKLGGPEFETIGVLGSNLDIFDPVAVAKANELCNTYGIDTITLGGIVSYLAESVEKGLITEEQIGYKGFGFGNADSVIWLIELIGTRTGVGDILADGFEAAIKHFGEATREYAVHVKGHGFAVHMPQVKPSLALMYAITPIGADHMSSEHDWLITDDSEASRGLGIMETDDVNSTGTNKVRMTVYSQYYYSVLDTLNLCMFCWGAGSLYTYPELEDLVKFSTGMDMTFWELMMAGERKITMMRLLNLRRGFTDEDDKLPAKMFEPLYDGPSKGRSVNEDDFNRMKAEYYGFLGWNEQGVPRSGKLAELGLEWVE
ncbi:MAG: aldehyde ferredoxin oxidoreductase family protein [Spirochaetia bacterium]|jgi:aldehyde:ferredoxin oxidoreductase|nr:aldehyde ferredoxin oxidoreductase family protein [Spirochaetia bacterium]